MMTEVISSIKGITVTFNLNELIIHDNRFENTSLILDVEEAMKLRTAISDWLIIREE